MISLEPPFRIARQSDALAMAELVNMAGEGIPAYLWAKQAGNSKTIWDIGCERAQRDQGAFSYRNTIVCEEREKVVASLVSYAIAAEPTPIDRQETPAMFIPMLELENLALATWYVNVLATYPAYRGRGFATRLLNLAELLAKSRQLFGVSLIVADTNLPARKLYEQQGYREVARRQMVKEKWQHPGREWVLMIKRIG